MRRRYVIIAHGAEITVPGGCSAAAALARRRDARRGRGRSRRASIRPRRRRWRAGRSLAGVVVPPGVDPDRFRPLDARRACRDPPPVRPRSRPPARARVSRLVPRKGFDILIDAIAAGGPGLDGVQLAIAGAGRDRRRLERRATGPTAARSSVGCPTRISPRCTPAPTCSPCVAASDGADSRPRASGSCSSRRRRAAFRRWRAAAEGRTRRSSTARPGSSSSRAMSGRRATRSPGSSGDRDLRVRMGEAARRRAVESFDNDRAGRRPGPGRGRQALGHRTPLPVASTS